MQHIKAPSGSISIQPPLVPCVGVQIVEPDRQVVCNCISRVVLYLEATDRTGGVEEN